MDSWLGPPSMRSWRVLPGSAWVSSGDAGFFPHPTDVHIGGLGVSVLSPSECG